MRISRSQVVGGLVTLGAALTVVPMVLEARIASQAQGLDEEWRRPGVSPRGKTMLGISIRPRQMEAFGLEAPMTVKTLLQHQFSLVRIPAYWNRVEPRPGVFDASEPDWLLEAAERAGKQVILSVGAVKNYGYPEFFVPEHHLDGPLREGALVRPSTHPALLDAATAFIREIVSRYADRKAVIAWQLEHEAVDPLGMEHSWRLSEDFVRAELDALKATDPTRPVLMNGFMPTSSLVGVSQWWRTRDQGDSLAVASRLADIVGIDFYPRHALLAVGRRTLYLAGADRPWRRALATSTVRSIEKRGRRVMITEGQAEPWEAVTTPPDPEDRAMFSCRPEDVIRNYNAAMAWAGGVSPLQAYLFWGAEYWIRRWRSGDPSYLMAFRRVVDESG